MRNKRFLFDKTQRPTFNTQDLLSFESYSQDQELNEDFLYLKEKLAQFKEKKKFGCGTSNSSFIKNVFKNLSFLLNEIKLTRDKVARVDKIDNVKKWFLRKLGMNEFEANCKESEEGMIKGGNVLAKEQEGAVGLKNEECKARYLFCPVKVFEIKRESRQMARFTGNRKKRGNWVSYSPEVNCCENYARVGDYNSGRSLKIRNLESKLKLTLKTDTQYKSQKNPKKDSTKNLRLSSELILKSSTVQDSARKCFEYSRRIFRK